MPRLVVAVQNISRGGLLPAYTAPQVLGSGGNYFANDGRTAIYLKADGTAAASTNITFETPGLVDGQAIADRVVALAVSTEKVVGPFPPGVYNQPGSDSLYFDCSAVVTGITIAILRLP
jgi:hypothetical protein